MSHQKILNKIKIELMMDSKTVFYTTILFSLKVVWDEAINTAGTDGIRLIVAPSFFMQHSSAERKGLILHEIMHVALKHMTRLGTRDTKIYRKAADYVVNGLLIDSGYSIPSCGLYDPQYKGMSTEQVYAILKAQTPPKQGGSSIAANGTPDDNSDMSQDLIFPSPEDFNKVDNQIINTVLRAKTQAELQNKQAGNIPGEALLTLDKSINPKLPWNVILQNYMHSMTKDDYTWQKPNKRFFPEYYLPTAYSEALDHVCVAVDSSGSVLLKQFGYFITEVQAIQEQLMPVKMTLICFDTKIQGIHDISQDTNMFNDIKFSGGGGTNIEPIMDWAEKNNPEILLIFTDGYFCKPQEFPKNEIVWLIHDNPSFTIDHGLVIHHEIEE